MPEFQERVRNFFKESKRVFLVTKKPGWEEYKKAAKITGLGILVIGLVGMLIRIIGILMLGG
ncbi:protein translocase SEC61 complex subunit gamma [Pyrococcus horikoshii]|uniref:Protein translocase subunit SecE n=2 Tax=Pyrococcus horikoshii TaxID=53953 RepID=SECE_PYRHO|nr:protein translocase SEC61 complex subunit gamma [Pyrococcus horikoshii]P58199.1 RecName: Full=Protein translocase subunit SecE; AltName: Full=Protein transport protein Sec61 gamma subunit homolog [Pyrococcus horikoshii OT3]HII61633.1 protein translocase SEC61 complex subunit gamma [Pyrococcus horikoshii]